MSTMWRNRLAHDLLTQDFNEVKLYVGFDNYTQLFSLIF